MAVKVVEVEDLAVVDAGGMDLDEGDAFEVVKEDIDDVIDIVVAVYILFSGSSNNNMSINQIPIL